jgi:hypothetical protein
VTTVGRRALQRIENGFGDPPDGDGRCADNRNYCGATVGLDGAICPAGPIPDGVGPEKFAVYAHANSAAVFEKLNGTPVSQLAIKGAQLRRAGRLGIPGEYGTRAGNCFARLRKFFSVPVLRSVLSGRLGCCPCSTPFVLSEIMRCPKSILERGLTC